MRDEGLMGHEKHEYREDCPGCQITLCGESGRPFANDSPTMIAARKVWAMATLEEKRACNRVWVWNSRDPGDLQIMQAVATRIGRTLESQGTRYN
jgi:hypothetical protein